MLPLPSEETLALMGSDTNELSRLPLPSFSRVMSEFVLNVFWH